MLRARWNQLGLLIALFLFASGAPEARAEWVDWIAEAGVAVEFTDNLNNSAFNSDEEHDWTWFLNAEGGRSFQIGESTRVSVSATVEGEIHHHFDELNAYELGGSLGLFHKFGLGDAPWVRPFFWGGYKGISADERSGGRIEVGLETGKRFGPRFDASFEYRFTHRNGGDDGTQAWNDVSADVSPIFSNGREAGQLVLIELAEKPTP